MNGICYKCKNACKPKTIRKEVPRLCTTCMHKEVYRRKLAKAKKEKPLKLDKKYLEEYAPIYQELFCAFNYVNTRPEYRGVFDICSICKKECRFRIKNKRFPIIRCHDCKINYRNEYNRQKRLLLKMQKPA